MAVGIFSHNKLIFSLRALSYFINITIELVEKLFRVGMCKCADEVCKGPEAVCEHIACVYALQFRG